MQPPIEKLHCRSYFYTPRISPGWINLNYHNILKKIENVGVVMTTHISKRRTGREQYLLTIINKLLVIFRIRTWCKLSLFWYMERCILQTLYTHLHPILGLSYTYVFDSIHTSERAFWCIVSHSLHIRISKNASDVHKLSLKNKRFVNTNYAYLSCADSIWTIKLHWLDNALLYTVTDQHIGFSGTWFMWSDNNKRQQY